MAGKATNTMIAQKPAKPDREGGEKRAFFEAMSEYVLPCPVALLAKLSLAGNQSAGACRGESSSDRCCEGEHGPCGQALQCEPSYIIGR